MRSSVSLACVLLVTCAGFTPHSALAEPNDSTHFVAWYDGLRELELDPERGATVRDITIERDAGTFQLVEGTVHALRPIDGRTVGMVFYGTGRFRMAAPVPIEADQLERRLGSEEVDVPFRGAVFLFTDFTLSEIEQVAPLGPLAVPRDGEREASEAREYFTDGDGWVSSTVAVPLLNQSPGFFRAHFSEDRGDPYIFMVDPHNEEEVSFAIKRDRVKRPEVVSRFHRVSDYSTGRSLPQNALDLVAISNWDIETWIEDGLDLEGRATATLQRLSGTYSWVPFRLFSELEVQSVATSDGTPLPYYRPKDSSDLWVDLSTLSAGADSDVVFRYEGDMMDRPQDLWVQLGTHTTWFPMYRAGPKIPHRMTFHHPDDLVVTSVGEELSVTTADEVVTRVYQTEPTRLVTFNIGDFDLFESAPPKAGDPGLNVLVNESAHRRLSAMVAERGGLILEQRDPGEAVAIDLRNSFGFFNEVFGPTTVRDFVATEIPYSHGEAYAGLVMLAWNTFQWTSDKGFDEMFRAHEVAHQWWGIGVQPASYRDWWIAEGFSEFSGWWYAARARGSIQMYVDRLEQTREGILDRRGEAAPIALGQRAGSSDHPTDYQQTIYHKGAWVLHMLRTMLTDPDTGSDEAFTMIMNRFYQQHLGGTATTEDFEAIVTEVVGSDMSWYFDQWVRSSEIPTYTFSYRYEDTPDGQVKAFVRIRQEDVPDDFQMVVPVMLDFGEEGSATVRVLVRGPVTETELPILPREPESIEFNPFEAVLAETKTEGWRG